ncbi:hypothetical protein [Microbulbifer sp. GL-2]|uniref:hypothetical protein n=1 Tax=Microbulbifer sp. GL-2 TaxID=2591606 RepID=UPI001163AA77|nr:hypothetical protein [Microbulbifer sp. GL-2]BBM00595.1 hypothetical protein GL2_06690 [Microbulbifer sp. GL-2]
MGEEFAPKESELSQIYREGEVSVQIDIYEDGEGGWLLEIVDESNNSTVWEDSFETEKEALDEAMDALREEGIATFVGPVQEVDGNW